MLLFDHIAAGIALPSLIEPFQNTPAVAVSVIASVLPDATALYGWWGHIGYLSHRRASHALLFAPLLSIIPVLLVYAFMGPQIKNTLVELYLLSFLSYCIHIGIDTLTPFGTQILYPVSAKKLSFDLLASLEPVTHSISIIFILYYCTSNLPNGFIFRLCIALYLLYVVFTYARKLYKSRKYRRYLKARYPEAVYITTVPRLFWKWKGIGKLSSTYIVISDAKGEDKCKLYQTEIDIPDKIKTNRHYGKFMDYARFPVPLANKDCFSLINLLYNPQTLRLDFVIDENGKFVPQKLTGIKIPDRGI